MPYYCVTQGCFLCDNKIEFNSIGNCQVCGNPLSLKAEFDEFEKDIINHYPYVIAFPFKKMLEEVDYFTKFSLLIDVFVNTLKYNALLVATEYFKSSLKSEELNNLFVEKLGRPNHGHWNEFLKQSINFLEGSNYNFFVKELPFVYHQIESGNKNNIVKQYLINKSYTDKEGHLRTDSHQKTAIIALLYYRNEKFAHTQTLAKDEYKKLYFICYAILKDILKAINFCTSYPMYKADRMYYYSLMGAEVKQSGVLTGEVNKKDNVWIQDSSGNRLPLLPFFVQPSQFIAGALDSMQILMYEGNTLFKGVGGRMIFDSPESFKPEAQGEILNMFYDLLENKKVLQTYNEQTFDSVILKERLNQINNKVLRELMEERKLLKGIYQRREDAEITLRSWVGARAGIFLLTAEAGSGKTNLLWEMKNQYQEKFGLDVLFLRASRFSEDDLESQLKYLFHLSTNFSFIKCKAFNYTQDKPLILLIDGGNEHTNPVILLQSIVNFLQLFSIGAIKVVLTWRTNTHDEIPEFNDSWNDWLYNTDTEIKNEKKYLWLKSMNKIELEGAWKNYKEHPTQTRYRVQFTLNELLLADRPLADQLSNPLLLKLFLELYNGKTLSSKPKGFANIWAIWWKQRVMKQPNHTTFLTQLALLMANSNTNRLPLDSLYEDKIIGLFIRNYQVDSPYQQLLQSNILTQFSINNCLYVSFTIESVLHYALCQYLLKQPVIAKQFGEYINKGDHWKQAVQFCLWDAALKNKIWLLEKAIKSYNIPAEVLAKPLANAFLILDANQLLDIIIKNNSEKEWKLFHEVINIINEADKQEFLNNLVKFAFEYKKIEVIECNNFFSSYFYILSYDFAEKYLQEVNSLLGIVTNSLLKMSLLDIKVSFLSVFDRYSKQRKLLSEELLNLSLFSNGLNSDITASYYIAYGTAKKDCGEGATEQFLKALEILKSIYKETHISILSCFIHLSDSCLKGSNKTLEYLNLALGIGINELGNNHSFISSVYNRLGKLHYYRNNFAEALQFHFKQLEIDLFIYGENHLFTGLCYGCIGQVYEDLYKLDDAIKYTKKWNSICKFFYGISHHETNSSTYCLIDLYIKNQQYEEALKGYLELYDAFPIDTDIMHFGNFDIRLLLIDIGNIYNKLDKIEKSFEFYDKAQKIISKSSGEDSMLMARLNEGYGSIYEKLGEFVTSASFYLKSYDHKRRFWKDDHIEMIPLLKSIKRVN